MSERFNVIGAEDLREAIEKSATAGVRGEGVIDREEQAIYANHLNGATERRLSEVAAGGDVNIRLEVGGHRLAKMGRGA